ncbi:MAG: biotin/lipoate A/B protein ligase family protein [Chloroflexi bacterium]|nr:biotin/lipoate A/B protein ligase family protein [Chloroflexota bacterium]
MRSILEPEFNDGAWNMAVDSAIVDAVSAGKQPPTLRLYGWDPFCLSLGYGQRLRDADLRSLSASGWDIVRRPTGGKAILHGDELTYSLCMPINHPLSSGDVVESYRRISVGLLRALESLGLSASARRQGSSARHRAAGPVCFEQSSHYEIVVDGRKLIGSAQLRRKGVLLQHGTIPLGGDVTRICDVLVFDSEDDRDEQRTRLRERAATLAQVLGREPSWAEVAAALERGFSENLDAPLNRDRLSECEAARAHALREERYANPKWTNKR